MSETEQDAVIGRTIREHKASTAKLEILNAEAAQIGFHLVMLGTKLTAAPSTIFHKGEAIPPAGAG